MPPDLIYLVKFSCLFEFVGPTRLKRLIAFYGSVKEAWENLDDKILIELGLSNESRVKFWKLRREAKDIDFDKLEREGVKVIDIEHEMYPKKLKEIYDPPYLLFVRGEIKPEDELALAVVGSRKMTRYGQEVCESLIPELSSAGLTIVSGLALGVDAVAHRAALEVGGRTIAILASGVDKITPTSNLRLAEEIISSGRGAVISEFPLGTEPQPFFFPVRNRIISGISLGVLVIEAAKESGALITASCALEQGREVFVVPGSIFNPLSEGTNELIKKGAKPVTCAADILTELDILTRAQKVQAKKVLPESPEEVKLLSVLEDGEKHIDEITREVRMDAGQVSSLLTMMEIRGLVRGVGGGTYRKV